MRTNIYGKMRSAVTFLAVGLLLWNCSGGTREPASQEKTADTLYPEARLSAEIKQELYALPTPLEITIILEKSRAGYIFDITNPPGNAAKYIAEREKALNLGVYTADLAYSATYGQKDATNKFLACTAKLSDELGIAGIYEAGLVERVKRVGNNRDSLVGMVENVLMHTSSLLARQNRHYLAVLIATGAFVEGLYLAAELNVVAENNTLISSVIEKQQLHLNQLLTVMEPFRECKQMDALFQQLTSLRSVFTDFGLKPGKPLPREKAMALSDVVEKVRNEII
ncbi:MAG: hypothetical protein EOM90_11880 [Alphaproteobacteria bacterium]|nr:hypothetical protein [Alphaproteobacteria bacterium]